MLEQLANSVTFYAHYIASKVGATGLTVTVDVWEVQKDGTATEIVTAGSATEIGDGLYRYLLVSGSVDAEGEYIAVFKTSDSSVDQQHLPALWSISRAGIEDLDAPISSRSTVTTAQVNAEVDTAIETYHLDHLLAVAYDPASKPGAADALLNELVENDGGISRYAANALEQAPTAPTVGQVADAVWDEAIAGHLSAGSTGAKLNSIGGVTFPSGAIEYTYTVTDSVTTFPLEGVEIWICTDLAGTNCIWKGETDVFGIARDVLGNLPMLDSGTYFIFRQLGGYTFVNPDQEVVD